MLAGRRYALDKSPYQAIEFAWNPVNLWVNMQPNPKKYVSLRHLIGFEFVEILNISKKCMDGVRELCVGGVKKKAAHEVLAFVVFREGIASISWDFTNINLWESVLDLDQATPHVEDPSTDPAIAFGKKVEEQPAVEQPGSKPKKGEIVVKKDVRGDIASYHWFLGLSWVPKLDIPVDNYVTRFARYYFYSLLFF